jgi:hypothetical protein
MKLWGFVLCALIALGLDLLCAVPDYREEECSGLILWPLLGTQAHFLKLCASSTTERR